MAVSEKLEPDARVVLKAIIDLCGESANDITNFDGLSMYKLVSAEDRVKYKLSIERQMEIFSELSDAHIIDTDQIINTDFYGPGTASTKSKPKLYWKNNTEWAKRVFQFSGLLTIEQAYNKYKSALFINMPIEEANRLYNSYIADHTVCLKLNTAHNRLYIKIDTGGEWKGLPIMHEGSLSYEIIKLAWKNAGHKVTLKQLDASGDYSIYNGNEEKYISSIYERNNTVKALHPKLLFLGDHYMVFKKSAKYTYDDLCDLRAALKI